MKKKGSKEKSGVKKAGAKKVAKKAKVGAKAKKAPSKKKKVVKGTTQAEKKKTTKKTVKREVKKVKAEKKKPARKAVKKEIKKVKPKVTKKVKKEEKAKKKVVVKKEKKVPLKPEKKVRAKKVIEKPEKKVKEVALPKKAVPRKPKKVLLPVVEEKYPPLPVEILPEEYGEDSITLMTVDPRGLFTYWEVREETIARYKGTLTLRVYDVTGVDFDGTNAKSSFDIPATQKIGSWYIDVSPEREFIVDIGMIDPSSNFIVVARSNKVSTPREGIAEEGVLPEKLYETGLPIGYLRADITVLSRQSQNR